ncbi:THAP domain-containing protein 5-like [Mugil cephalus]|uniref:THAP domain-containing protein 5-like n=1 Tax=Mugil cephalus TaxID=48193 RepID=UPI001FB79EFE|nr:THAP domain-containing protein 5-like [Mugil cephalus]
MPKYCSVPNCRNDSGGGGTDRKSFYKFPLQDPVRLQQWLRNMGRENWTPSRHQYICHEHFAPSCFKVRWGIRYLENDAVPTVFQEAEKRKAATDHSEMKPKRLRVNSSQSTVASDDRTTAFDAVEMQNMMHTVHLYEIAVDPSQHGEMSLVESGDAAGYDCSLQTGLDPLAAVDGAETRINVPLTLFQTVDDLGDGGGSSEEVVVMSECSAGEGQDELVSGITAAILTQGHRLVVNDPTLGCSDEAVASGLAEDVTYTTEELSDVHRGHGTQVIAYFQTIPSVFPSDASPRFTFSPDTVLSSALSSKPITSTLPIVSKHATPSPTVVLNVERLDSEGGEGDEGKSEEEDTEQQDQQLEEHCYHKNSLSKEQLEAIVAELQKKVKVLQQRHRRHLEKLLGLENVVSQLRQNNLLNEERLQLLERAYIQTSAAASHPGETVAIIYEEDDVAYLCTPLNDSEEKL